MFTQEGLAICAEHLSRHQIGLQDLAFGIERHVPYRSKFVEIVKTVPRPRQFDLTLAQLFVLQLQFDLVNLELMDDSLGVQCRHAGFLRRTCLHQCFRPRAQGGT